MESSALKFLIYLSPLFLVVFTRLGLWATVHLWQRWHQTTFPEKILKRFFPSLDLWIFFLGVHLFLTGSELLAADGIWHRLAIVGTIVTSIWMVDVLLLMGRRLIQQKFNAQITDDFQKRKLITQWQFVIQIARVIIWVVGIGFCLTIFPQMKILGSSLLASAGIASVVLGLAAQKSITNLLAGLQISFTQPIKIDDVVIVEGEWGKVEEITLTYVVVRIWDLRRLVLPITYFIDHPFENWTRESQNILGSIFLFVDYSLDVGKLRTAFITMAQKHPLWDGKVAALQVVDTTEKSMKLRALVSAANASAAWDLRCDLREQLIAYLQIHFPQALPKIRLEAKSKEEEEKA